LNYYLGAAGILCVLLGIAHSIMGEIIIFRKRKIDGTLIRIPYRRIIRSSWHIVSLLGFALGAIIFEKSELLRFNSLNVAALLVLLSGILVLFLTKGKHPAWIILGMISVLIFLN